MTTLAIVPGSAQGARTYKAVCRKPGCGKEVRTSDDVVALVRQLNKILEARGEAPLRPSETVACDQHRAEARIAGASAMMAEWAREMDERRHAAQLARRGAAQAFDGDGGFDG